MAEQHKITHDMEPMLLTSAEVAGCGYVDGYGEVLFDGDLDGLERALRQRKRPFEAQAELVAKMVKECNNVDELEGLLGLYERLQDSAQRLLDFVRRTEGDKKSNHRSSTNAEKRGGNGVKNNEDFAPEPIYVEGIVDSRWRNTVEMLTGEYRLFEADRSEDLMVAMGAKAGRLKVPLCYLGNNLYALCYVMHILDDANAWGGGGLKEICRRLATCIVKIDGARIQGEAIRTSIPKDERKRRSLRTTYEPLRRLWDVE